MSYSLPPRQFLGTYPLYDIPRFVSGSGLVNSLVPICLMWFCPFDCHFLSDEFPGKNLPHDLLNIRLSASDFVNCLVQNPPHEIFHIYIRLLPHEFPGTNPLMKYSTFVSASCLMNSLVQIPSWDIPHLCQPLVSWIPRYKSPYEIFPRCQTTMVSYCNIWQWVKCLTW